MYIYIQTKYSFFGSQETAASAYMLCEKYAFNLIFSMLTWFNNEISVGDMFFATITSLRRIRNQDLSVFTSHLAICIS